MVDGPAVADSQGKRDWRIDTDFSVCTPCQCPFVQSAPVGTRFIRALYNTDVSCDSLHVFSSLRVLSR